MDFLRFLVSGFGLPETVALAAVAAIGYVVGRRRREAPAPKSAEAAQASEIARQLEAVAAGLRNDLAIHGLEVRRFQDVIASVSGEPREEAWLRLRNETERVLEPTLRLVNQIAIAYDQFRRQSQALADFSGDRTDPLTGLGNSKALTELLEVELSSRTASGAEVSLVIIGLPATPDDPDAQSTRLLLATELLRPQLREADRLGRYGIDELVVVMPQTRLYGACVFGRRIRDMLAKVGVDVSTGIAQSVANDKASSLLGRADSALYSAKALVAAGEGGAPKGAQFLHNGRNIRRDSDLEGGVDDLGTEPEEQILREALAIESRVEPIVDSAAETATNDETAETPQPAETR